MKFPYTVKVKSNKGDIDVSIKPDVMATEEKHIETLNKAFTGAILEYSGKTNNTMTRIGLKNRMLQLLHQFHDMGIIKPKDSHGTDGKN